MKSVENLLNRIADFKCEIDEVEIIFPGILQEQEKNIVLNAKFPIEQYRKIISDTKFIVLGDIAGKEITLIGCHIQSGSCDIRDENISLFIIPNEILIGKCFSSMPMVKRIIVSTVDLNYMFFGNSPLRFNYDLTKDNPSVLDYTFPKTINAKDKYGEIKLYQTFSTQWSVNSFAYSISSVIQYSFTDPMLLMDAVAKLAAARSLFSFFGNGYISFGEISFEVDDDKEYGLWLNYKDDVPAINEPFLISTSAFENQFQKIWNNWLDLYESTNPISALFYEIVCNRSTGINGFLNLSQAIEVYCKRQTTRLV